MTMPPPLLALQKSLGARFDPHPGGARAQSFGDPAREVAALQEAAGLVDQNHRARLAITGPDRLLFLHGQCTNEVKTLLPGQGKSAFFLDHKGRNLGLARYLITEQRILFDISALATPTLVPHLERFMMLEDVQLQDLAQEFCLLLLAGPKAQSKLQALAPTFVLPAEEDMGRLVSWAGAPFWAIRDRDTGRDGVRLWVPSKDVCQLYQALIDVGVAPAGLLALDTLRVAAGRPRFGRDFGDTVLPEETGQLERTVSFEKGCYLGQEQVAMQHHRGRPRKMLTRLLIDPGNPKEGDPIFSQDQNLGRLGTLACAPPKTPRPALATLKGCPTPQTPLQIRPEDPRPPLAARVLDTYRQDETR